MPVLVRATHSKAQIASTAAKPEVACPLLMPGLLTLTQAPALLAPHPS